MQNLEHKKWMSMALEQAHLAAQKKEVPVGAVVVQSPATPQTTKTTQEAEAQKPNTLFAHSAKMSSCERMLCCAHNRTEELSMATRHAEVEAIEQASQQLGRWRLYDCILYSTLEPCIMCMGAIMAARLKAVVYGAPDPQRGASFLLQSQWADHFNHHIQLIGPIDLRGGEVLRQFFAAKR